MNNLIVFDLDGVITSEDAYWDAAGLTLHELLYSPRYWNVGADGEAYRPAATAEESRRISRALFPESEIVALKARAINSNWDTCYVTVCLHLINLLALLESAGTSLASTRAGTSPAPLERAGTSPAPTYLLPLQPWDADWLTAFRGRIASVKGQVGISHTLIEGAGVQPLDPLSGYVGLELISHFDAYASEVLGYPIEGVFSRYSPFWPFCQDIFQQWYLGDERYTQCYGRAPVQLGKPGCVYFEQPLLPVEAVRATLETLRLQGYVLGYATGRPSQEAEVPLKLFGLLEYFDERHISTYDDVVRAEAELRAKGEQTLLGKPHPFPFLVAFDDMAMAKGSSMVDPDHRPQGSPPSIADTARARESSMGDPDHRRPQGATVQGNSMGDPDHRRPQGSPPNPTLPPPLLGTTGAFPQIPSRESLGLYEAPLPLHVIVGDSTGDILAGRAAGALTVAVLTGARTVEARRLLAESGPDFTIEDVTELPRLLAHIDSLATIQRLQFSEREKAERLLRRWFVRHMNLRTEGVTLTPKPVSLNSFNGFYRADGEDYFFKTHVEEQGSIQEYYHAEMLHEAGYNVVMPLRTLHEEGRQMVIYPVVGWPVVFDLMRTLEVARGVGASPTPTQTRGEIGQGDQQVGGVGASLAPTQVTMEVLAAAERRECERLLNIYRSTLAASTAEEHAGAPIHQLFWHRLTGGRFKSFYEGRYVPLPIAQDEQPQESPLSATARGSSTVDPDRRPHSPPDCVRQGTQSTRLRPPATGHTVPQTASVKGAPLLDTEGRADSLLFDELLTYRWVINGVEQQRTLGELIERAKVVLDPARAAMTVIGHGDAHFGNVFLEGNPTTGDHEGMLSGGECDHSTQHDPCPYLYFDPAFAGRHSPLLDIVKPLFHNIFASWMYFPQDVARELQLTVSLQKETLFVEHDYTLAPVRQAILQTKIEHLLRPLIEWLRSLEALPTDWLEMVQLALMCCPLLTINLVDGERLPVTVSWLGLSQAVQMGNSGMEMGLDPFR